MRGISRCGCVAVAAFALCSYVAASVLTEMERDVADVVARVSPSVVSIRIEPRAAGAAVPLDGGDGRHQLDADAVRAYVAALRGSNGGGRIVIDGQSLDPSHFATMPGPRQMVKTASGVLTDDTGHILTCSTGLRGDAEITVTLSDGRSSAAKIAGVDLESGVAVLKLSEELSDLPPAPSVADAGELRPGNWAIVIGNQAGSPGSVSVGNIAATGRTLGSMSADDFVQLAAPISPGLSGAPVFDSQGRLMGLVYAAYAPARGTPRFQEFNRYDGDSTAGQALFVTPAPPTGLLDKAGPPGNVGFAIPAGRAMDTARELIATGVVTRGWLGVQIRGAAGYGVVVDRVLPDTPAEAAGVLVGDVITVLEGQAVDSARALKVAIESRKPGATVDVTLVRDGEEQRLPVTVGARPDAATARIRGSATATALAAAGASTPEALGIITGAALLPAPGLVVNEVAPDTPAERAGLMAGDVITRVNKTAVWGMDGLHAALVENAGQYVIRIEVNRSGEEVVLYIERE